MSRIVIALGGNAISAGDPSAAGQEAACLQSIQQLKPLLEHNEAVLTHGNGPQVGALLLQQEAGNTSKTPAMPLATVGAMSQGSIGYWLEQASRNGGLNKLAVCLVTPTLVDQNDPAFQSPSKPIGPFYQKEQVAAQQKLHPDAVYKEDAGRGWRQVVASPKPLKIMNTDLIDLLLKHGSVPIVAGGGGIPVVKDDQGLHGVDAVIDKDWGAALLARTLHADRLIILTAVDHAYINFGKKDQQALTRVCAAAMGHYLAEGQFAAGSMAPKVEACLDFVAHTGHEATIAALSDAGRVEQGAGTTIYA